MPRGLCCRRCTISTSRPEYPEFSARTMWSLSNAFTSAFKRLDPIPQFKATAKLGEFSHPASGIASQFIGKQNEFTKLGLKF